jgi:hypothetical protein
VGCRCLTGGRAAFRRRAQRRAAFAFVDLNLPAAAIDEQFDARDKAGIV